jgi:hypothetical protein
MGERWLAWGGEGRGGDGARSLWRRAQKCGVEFDFYARVNLHFNLTSRPSPPHALPSLETGTVKRRIISGRNNIQL